MRVLVAELLQVSVASSAGLQRAQVLFPFVSLTRVLALRAKRIRAVPSTSR